MHFLILIGKKKMTARDLYLNQMRASSGELFVNVVHQTVSWPEPVSELTVSCQYLLDTLCLPQRLSRS